MSRSLLTNETSELDLLDQRPFEQTDFDILKSYEAVVDGLAMLIGSHCEIVLHSLQDLKCSAIRIANGEHTGRKIGSPITDLALRMLHDMTGADSSVSKCYFTREKRCLDEVVDDCHSQPRAARHWSTVHQHES